MLFSFTMINLSTNNLSTNKYTKIILVCILLIAACLRLYKLDSVPPSLSWDEVANGYNAWTIANYGTDEYGRIFPLYFESFRDDKHPIHFYLSAISIKLFGLNEFATRLPAAFIEILCVLLIFYIGKTLFNSQVGLIASFFLAISPYNLHFSRTSHEANTQFFFFLLGIFLFLKFLKKGGKYLPWSVLSFCICFITYHPAKVVVPFFILLLLSLYFKDLLKSKISLLISSFIILAFGAIVITNTQLLGIARIDQSGLRDGDFERARIFKLTNNHFLGRIEITLSQYLSHFSPEFLFITGDKNARLSSQKGEFYKIDFIFLLAGFLYLLYKRSKAGVLLLGWALIGPVPASLAGDAPHGARASFMMGSWHLISAFGFYTILNLIKSKKLKTSILVISIVILSFSLFNNLKYYFGEYTTRYAFEWQYGMKQIAKFVSEHQEYSQVFVTDVRSQPYIFFLYYLQFPLPVYLNSVVFNQAPESKRYNNVSSFGGFYKGVDNKERRVNLNFGNWNPIESKPLPGVLYVLTPSQYDGLRSKSSFDIKSLIYYPNGTDAYYIIAGK